MVYVDHLSLNLKSMFKCTITDRTLYNYLEQSLKVNKIEYESFKK